ncbi:histidine kinase [Methylobacterium sp. ID0610]|uniref:histidine kinase n=1 Tax=Methylobacterium carpenticola TaxID=3344827 RepID=UPI0036AE9D89
MADYYPLLARALDALPDHSPDMREAVYERARAALTGQLRSLDPPLSEEDIDAERRSLDAAIDRLETEYGGAPAPPEPAPEAALPEPPAAEILPEPGPPVALKLPEPDRPKPEPAADSAAEDGQARQRPRIDVVRPKGDRSGLLRNGIVASVLAAVIGAIAFTAWSLRDTPATLQSKIDENAAERPPEPQESKFADRVGGERAPQAALPGTPAKPATAAGGDITIAQRATLYEETGGPNNGPRAMQGQAVWRLDAVNAGQGQPLQTVVRGTIDVQEAGLSLAMVIRRNTDATLPASHVIELTFTPNDPARAVRDVGLLQFKDDESARGSPVSGLPVPVRENIFLIGLSSLKGDVERNGDLLLRRNWIDLPVRYASGGRAILTFEKGAAGEKVMRDAFAQWQ